MNIIKRLVLFFILLLTSIIHGQTCDFRILGIVKDLHDGEPIFGAVVEIKGTDFYGQTNKEGYFELTGICEGSVQIIVSHIQCNPVERSLTIESDVELSFALEHHINELEEIILIENGITQVNTSVSESQMNADQLARMSNQSLAETLNVLPGVSALKTGSSIAKPMIHGLYGSRVAIIANGMRLQDQEWGADHAPNIDLNGFESVQVVKGAAALKYGGDASGGMIVLSPQRIRLKDSLYGNTILNGVDNGKGGGLSSRLTKSYDNGFYFSGQLATKYFGDRQAPDYFLTNTALKESSLGFTFGRSRILKGWQLKYTRFQNETGILRSAHIGNIQDLLRAVESEIPLRVEPFDYAIEAPKQQALHQSLQASYFNQISDQSLIRIDYNYQINSRKEFDVRRANRSELPAIDLTLQTHDFLGSIKWRNGFDWEFEWGLNGLLQDNFSNPETGVKRLIPDYLKYQIGSFITGNYKPSNIFNWEWGLRFDKVFMDAQKFYDTEDWIERGYNLMYSDYEQKNFGTQLLVNPKLNFLNISAQTGIAIRLSDSDKTTLSYILTQRAPNVSELFSDGLHHSLATIEYGNLTLDKETSHKVLLGFKKENTRLSFGIDSYLNSVSNFIYIEPTGVEQTTRGAFPVWSYNSMKVFMWGWDVFGEIQFAQDLEYTFNAAYTYAQDLTKNEPLILVPPFAFNQQMAYTLSKKNIEILLSQRFTGTQNRFPDTNFSVNLIESGTIIQKQLDVSTPPTGYHNLDIYFSLPLTNQTSFKSTIRLIVLNLTNTTYNDYLNRLRYYAAEIGRSVQLQLVLKY